MTHKAARLAAAIACMASGRELGPSLLALRQLEHDLAGDFPGQQCLVRCGGFSDGHDPVDVVGDLPVFQQWPDVRQGFGDDACLVLLVAVAQAGGADVAAFVE